MEENTKAPEKYTPIKNLIEWYEGKLQYNRIFMDVSTVVLIRDTIHRLKELQVVKHE